MAPLVAAWTAALGDIVVQGSKRRETLTPQHHAAIQALLKTGAIKDAARAAKTTTKTIYEWLKREDFAAELKKHQTLAHMEVAAKVNKAVVAALKQAEALLKESTREDGPRAAVIKALLEHHRWQVDRLDGAAKGGIDPKTGAPVGATGGIVVKVTPMTPAEVDAARAEAKARHEAGGDDAA